MTIHPAEQCAPFSIRNSPYFGVLIVLWLIFSSLQSAYAAGPELSIVRMSYLEDVEGTLALEDVAQGAHNLEFSELTGTALRRGMSDRVHWIKLEVSAGDIVADLPAVLAVRYAWFKDIKVYHQQVDGRYYIQKESKGESKWQWLTSRDSLTYPVFLTPESANSILIRVHPTAFAQTSIEIYSLVDFLHSLKLIDISGAVFLSIIITAIVYSVFVSLSARERTYFGCYAFFLIAIMLVADEFRHADLLRKEPLMLNSIINVSLAASAFFYIKFHQRFLGIQLHFPKVNSLLVFFQYAIVAAFLITNFWKYGPLVLSFILVIISGILGVTSFLRARKGFSPGYYAAAASFLLLLGIFGSLVASVSSNSSALTKISYHKIGFLLDVIFLSVALVKKLHIIQHEKLELQEMLVESAEQNVRLKTALFDNISHELLTPINGVHGGLELLRDEPMSEGVAKAVGIIKESNDRVTNMVRVLLTYVDSINPDKAVEKVDINLMDILNLANSYFTKACAKKGLEFQFDCSDKVPMWIHSEKSAIQNVTGCLLSNALKFTDHGKIRFGITAERLDSDQSRCKLVFTVADTGVGISEDQIKKIFWPFSQTDQSITRKNSGLGIGLSIAFELARQVGGNISCKSVEGQGSEFTFDVIVECIEAKDIASQVTNSERGEREVKALLVDDNSVNLLVIKKLLESTGCKVRTVENGALAVEAVKEQDFDIIFMDCQMPVMDGLTATRQIRALGGDKAKIPIVAITANVMAQDRGRCLDAGMNDYLEKPLVAPTLTAVVDRWAKHEAA